MTAVACKIFTGVTSQKTTQVTRGKNNKLLSILYKLITVAGALLRVANKPAAGADAVSGVQKKIKINFTSPGGR